jgi:hypothetical protein
VCGDPCTLLPYDGGGKGSSAGWYVSAGGSAGRTASTIGVFALGTEGSTSGAAALLAGTPVGGTAPDAAAEPVVPAGACDVSRLAKTNPSKQTATMAAAAANSGARERGRRNAVPETDAPAVDAPEPLPMERFLPVPEAYESMRAESNSGDAAAVLVRGPVLGFDGS